MKKTVYARDYGFLPSASAHENREALQRALDCGGEITVDVAGIYDVGGTVLIGGNTRLAFAEGTAVRRAALGEGQHDEGFIMNRGAYTRKYDEIIENGQAVKNKNYESEQEEILKEKTRLELLRQLDDIDKKRIRAVCEPAMKTETQSWLEYYNQRIFEIRQVMAEL